MHTEDTTDAGSSVAIAERTLRIETLRSQAIRALRAAIVTGELAPGEVHSARELAGVFGVSATPVREAMLELARERLVEPVQNKGFRITEISETDLREIVQLRIFVEVPAVGSVVGKVDQETAARLDSLAVEIEGSADQGDLGGSSMPIGASTLRYSNRSETTGCSNYLVFGATKHGSTG